MECKFLSNGIAVQYHNFVKPCCIWQADDAWINEHQISKVNLATWHSHKDLVSAREQLAQGIWPKNCRECQNIESQGRQDSIRLGGDNEYQHFSADDLTLEIRPGSVCNFACQTCWTPASTRVAEFYRKAEIEDPFKNFVKNSFDNFDFLDAVKHRLKKIIILGGEPFYDPKCLEFIQWSMSNTSAELMMFTNGSIIDFNLLSNLNRKFTLIFSIDAVGRAAEYIRFGTKWETVFDNFNKVRLLPNVATRVNITTSTYNFLYFADVIDLLIPDWPDVVTFGPASEDLFTEAAVPHKIRPTIIKRLEKCAIDITKAQIELGQKSNAINAVNSIIHNLQTVEYNQELNNKFKDFVNRMDAVKHIKLIDFCPEIIDLIT